MEWLKNMVCNNGKRKASILKQIGNVELFVRFRIIVDTFTACIKRCFAKYYSLCYNNIRISIQRNTTSMLRLQPSELGVIASTISIIILSGFPSIERRCWWAK